MPAEPDDERGSDLRRPLDGQVAVVTGSTRGIGRATARHLAALGARVVLNSRHPAPGETACPAPGETACPAPGETAGPTPGETAGLAPGEIAGPAPSHVAGDVMSLADVERMAGLVVAATGRLDVWVNNATGAAPFGFFAQLDPDEWLPGVAAKLAPVLNSVRAVAPIMRARGGGAIVNVISDAGRVGTPGETVIGAGAGAVLAASRALARELARDRIRVNNVSISLTRETGGYETIMTHEAGRRVLGKAGERAPLGLAAAADVAAAIAYLAASPHVTGQTLAVNGGLSMT
jgi:2-hydroxycyclohexanecarboxyl-CoA dehydrogenase